MIKTKKYYLYFFILLFYTNISFSNDKPLNPDLLKGFIKAYPASYLKRPGLIFINSIYNKIWHTKVTLPLLNLNKEILAIIGQGKSEINNLNLKAANGISYKFRLFKNHHDIQTWFIDSPLIMKSFFEGGHILLFPYSALLVRYLSEKLNILHTYPIICVFPENKEYSDFAFKMGYLEVNPKTKKNPYGAVKILNSLNFLKLYETKQVNINIKEYIFCRILDLYIGDGDRHNGQWKFAEFKDKKEWSPIPLDRDMAFLTLKGTLGESLIKADLDWKSFNNKSDFFSFDEKIFNPIGLMCKSLELDTVFFKNVQWSLIENYIKEFQNILSDKDIIDSLNMLPFEIVKILGDEFKKMLILRKKELIPAMKIYYDYIKSFNKP